MGNQGNSNHVPPALLSANGKRFPAQSDAIRRLKGPIGKSPVESSACNNPGSSSDAEGSGTTLPSYHKTDNENCLSPKHACIILESGPTKSTSCRQKVQSCNSKLKGVALKCLN